jgi:hypothetical protein
MELVPDPDSEVILDKIIFITNPKGKGQTVRFSMTLQPGEEPGGFSIETDFVHRTYKAVKETLTEEMIQQLESRYILEDSEISATAIGWRVTAAILTEDRVDWDICQTTMTLFWYTDHTASLYGAPWAANPTPINTHWYIDSYHKNLVSTYPSAIGHSWASYYNWDFGDDDIATTVQHDLYIYGYYDGARSINGNAYHSGEFWWLLHYHIYWW